jgi:hypothetical protein
MSMCNVLAVISERSPYTEATLRTAVELADRENARLTIARTCHSAAPYVWVTPFGSGAAYVDPEAESPEQACRAVALIARTVPDWIPVTTLVLDQSTEKGLVKLISGGQIGAVVAEAGLFSRCKRLRRLLAVEDVMSVPVVVDASVVEPACALVDGEGEGGRLAGAMPGGQPDHA